jgi:hypothetical protein
MTFPASVANLTKAVNEITAETNVPKSTLDAKVAQAEAEVPLAQAEQAAAEGYRDEAAAHAATAATHLATVKAGVAYQGISAILAEKAVTAVDVFVYDTSLDSDGGAWRKRCQHTSWYNEPLNTATRGARREFPAVTIIVAETDTVTIYDADDTTVPMWMVFYGATTYSQKLISYGDAGGIRAVSALNGILVVGTSSGSANQGANGVFRIDLVGDRAIKYCNSQLSTEYDAVLSTRNSGGYNNYLSGISLPRLASNFHNDVTMTVLPDAPIDPATGLPVPTIAVATGGGVSVIKDDGTVVDSAATNTPTKVSFNPEGLWYDETSSTRLYFATYADIASGDGFGDQLANSSAGTQEFDLIARPDYGLVSTSDSIAIGCVNSYLTSKRGLMLHRPNYTDQTKGMSALLTSTYNTGWMNGNIKGAFLSDTDDTDLVGSGELVTNGDFATNITGWTDNSQAGGSIAWNAAGAIDLITDASGNDGIAEQSISTVSGKTYVIDAQRVAGSTQALVTVLGTSPLFQFYVNEDQEAARTFIASSSSHTLQLRNTDANTTASIDNISVKLADADRSVNNKGLIVNGTVTRTPVATGADLVAYSGFSASNYLEQPYNSDLDFGTGDFCVMGWLKTGDNSTSVKQIFERTDRHLGFTGGGQITCEIDGTVTPGAFEISISDDNFSTVDTVRTTQLYDNNVWHYFAVVKTSSALNAYVGGVLVGSTAISNATGSLSNANAKLAVGARVGGASPFNVSGSGLALLRISATAPTAEQIAKIYNDEKVLFQENAQATLYGTSDAVTALAHDSDTGILSVGTSAGRSDFRGLRRVNNTTTAVGVAISASNGMIVEE